VFSTTDKFRRTDEQVYSIIDDEIVMLNVENGEYYNLNSTAKIIWEYLSEPRELDMIVNNLQEMFFIDREKCEIETIRFLDELLDLGLIEQYDN
jgi:hypothetical protein